MVTGPVQVSEREAEVLAALGARLTNAQIAGRLHISVRTVESHVSSLLRKYGVTDRRALADIAAQRLARDAAPVPLAGLPVARTKFIGRTEEIGTVRTALEDARLVTLLGPGGVGKTRLAVAAAAEFPGDGAFVDLVPVGDGFVPRAVAAALGVTEGTHQPLEEAITARLGRDRSLLVLDNCEHLIDEAAGFAARVLDDCPSVTVLVTSRERLGIPGERTVPVAPLPPAAEGAQLFLDRARAADPGFTADPAVVAELCARLDGMPLAIELAAARSASLGAADLLTALDDALRVLAGGRGPAERHRSLRAVIGWSHDLLDEEERALFRRLAVFAGPFDLAAVVAVTGGSAAHTTTGPAPRPTSSADVLGRLVDKSLVVHLRGEPSRWRLLVTIRAYATSQLTAGGEFTEVRDRHLKWACDVAASLEARLQHDWRDDWRDDFDAVADDLRAALAEAAPGPDVHRLAHTLGHLTYARRFLLEALDHYQRAAELAPTAAEAAQDLRTAADCAHVSTTSNLQVFELLLASAARAEEAGDGNAQAIALARAAETAARFPDAFPTEIPADRLRKLYAKARAVADPSDPVVSAHLAIAAAWNSLPVPTEVTQAARATADPVLISAALHAASTAAVNAGRLREGHRLTLERFGLLAEMDHNNPYTATEICNTYGVACTDAIIIGDLPNALATARQVLEDDLLGSHSYLSTSRLIPPLVLTGSLQEALRYATQLWDGWQRSGRPAARWLSPAVSAVALAYGLLNDQPGFQVWRSRATEVTGGSGAQSHLDAIAFVDARIALHTGNPPPSLVERSTPPTRPGPYQAYACAAAAELAVAAGLPEADSQVAAASAAADQNDWAAACLARTRGRLHADEEALIASVAGWERIGARFERACTLLLLPDRAAEGRAALKDLGTTCDGPWWTPPGFAAQKP